MPGLASLFRPLFGRRSRSRETSQPLEHVARRDSTIPAAVSRPDQAPTCARGNCSDAERLEHVAAYARAGYFNLGYTYETFHLISQLPPPD